VIAITPSSQIARVLVFARQTPCLLTSSSDQHLRAIRPQHPAHLPQGAHPVIDVLDRQRA
jgi:hypothetical protein